MDSFSEIFQAMVHDHGNRPRNFGNLDNPTHWADGVNPLTGDQLTIQLLVEDDLVTEVAFSGKFSALAATSASVMTSTLIGNKTAEAQQIITQTLSWFSGDEPVPADLPDNEYTVLLEIRNFSHRIHCASLAWKTAAKALSQR